MFNWLKQDRLIFTWTPPLIWASVILLFSVLPYNGYPPLTVGCFDKIAHFFEYTVLAVLMVRSMYRIESISRGKNLLFTLILSGGYGIVMELIQRLVPGREASLYDMGANITGVVFGMILAKMILWQK